MTDQVCVLLCRISITLTHTFLYRQSFVFLMHFMFLLANKFDNATF